MAPTNCAIGAAMYHLVTRPDLVTPLLVKTVVTTDQLCHYNGAIGDIILGVANKN